MPAHLKFFNDYLLNQTQRLLTNPGIYFHMILSEISGNAEIRKNRKIFKCAKCDRALIAANSNYYCSYCLTENLKAQQRLVKTKHCDVFYPTKKMS